jgi:glutathione S-transferase
MIILHTFGPGLGLPDPSPFVMKAMLLLKLAGLPYEEKPSRADRAPKHKLPVIEDDGVIVADSTFIRFHIEKKYGFDFDAGYDPAQRATAWAVEKMCEDHLYWAMLAGRWLDDENFASGSAHLFDALPLPLRPLVRALVRRNIKNSAYAQGMGRHNKTERDALAIRDIDALATLLGEKEFLLGAKPSAADATTIAFVIHLAAPLFDRPLRTAVDRHPNLLAYRDRALRAYFPQFSPSEQKV